MRLHGAVVEAVVGEAAAYVDHGRVGELALEDRAGQQVALVVESAHDLIEDDRLRPVQQHAREDETLLLLRAQFPVPPLLPIEGGDEVTEAHPVEGRAYRIVVEAFRSGGVRYVVPEMPIGRYERWGTNMTASRGGRWTVPLPQGQTPAMARNRTLLSAPGSPVIRR